ncbi:cytochrome P450 6k1-like [Chrysoperla carnea]|uniref:cytochrome P450 6k1-like n=1 Tax=Chrysoperla carnea TaxID=189513 RepID=UPI001D07FC6A|nr:cytochrome P450 6k1-like [Chrysoperla carnea]XP_044731390.1 cytochrome P450 6k1-like [Chrysoperla carnea]
MAVITSSWYTDLLTLTTGLLTILYFYLTSTYDYWKKRKVPYDPPVLLFGNFYNAFTFKRNISSYFYDLYRKTNEKYFGFYIYRRPYLLLRDPELIKHVLVKDFNNFVPRTNADTTNKEDVLGRDNIFTIKDPHNWRYLRAKFSPFFSTGKMRNMFTLLDGFGEDLNKYVKNHVNETIEVKDACRKYTTDVIVSTAFGIQANSFSDEEAEFSAISKKLFTFTLRRSVELICFFFVPELVTLFNFKLFSSFGTAFLRNAVSQAIEVREKNNINRPDLIDALIKLKNTGTLEDSPDLNDKQDHNKATIKFEGDILAAQAAVFFTAGFETTSSAISFTLYFLSYNPDIQIRLRKEIQTVIAENSGKFTYDSLAEMKYLDLCIKETLRLYPSLGFLDREAMSTYTFPGTDLTIDKGTPVIISLTGLHRDPQYFENPEVYDPERFNDENKSKFPPFAYIPFGEGPRNCVGARFGMVATKVGLVHILKDFEVVTFKTAPTLEIDPRGFLTSPKHGINLNFVKGTVYV